LKRAQTFGSLFILKQVNNQRFQIEKLGKKEGGNKMAQTKRKVRCNWSLVNKNVLN